MSNAGTFQGRDRTAIAISIAAHLCVLLALAAVFRNAFPSGEPDERAYLTSLIRIERRPTPAPEVRHHVLGTRPVAVVTPPPIHAAAALEHAARPLVVQRENRAGAAERLGRKGRPVPIPVALTVALAAPTAAAIPVETASPAPTPAPAATEAAPEAARDDAIGNFGETYPAAVEPHARSAFFSGLSGAFDVRVSVDESGRATAIEFVRAPDDPGLRDQLRARLLAARFVPAACNGLRCAGTVELRN